MFIVIIFKSYIYKILIKVMHKACILIRLLTYFLTYTSVDQYSIAFSDFEISINEAVQLIYLGNGILPSRIAN